MYMSPSPWKSMRVIDVISVFLRLYKSAMCIHMHHHGVYITHINSDNQGAHPPFPLHFWSILYFSMSIPPKCRSQDHKYLLEGSLNVTYMQ